MALSDSKEWGVTSRNFPQPAADGLNQEIRLWHDQSQAVNTVIPDFKAMADEGTYFVAMNTPSFITNAIAGNIATAITDTIPTLFLQNGNPATSGVPDKRVYLDRVSLVLAVIPGSNTNLQFAWKVDPLPMTISGGTNFSPGVISGVSGNVNSASVNKSSLVAYAGVLTKSAASPAARFVSAGVIRGTSTAPAGAIGDVYHFKFGSVDPAPTIFYGALTVALPVALTIPCPAIILGPQASASLYIWGTSMATTAPSWWPEVAYGER
jgi:hypothetical protein